VLAARRRIEPETWLLGALGRDLDLALLADVGDGGILQGFLHRVADLRARTPQEALPVGKAFALGIEAAVDEVRHGVSDLMLSWDGVPDHRHSAMK